MTLSYRIDPFGRDGQRRTVRARLTTEHSASSYGQPVLVLPDGGVVDALSWAGCAYRVERATVGERAGLARLGFIHEEG